ncbi:hypothetical protein ACWDV4_14120 [Micromonospora sp. NPDC003197]
MTVFACAGCGAALTVPVSQVALPAHAHQTYGLREIYDRVQRGPYGDPF